MSADEKTFRSPSPTPASMELFGALEANSPYVMVSDGGREFNMVVERCGETFIFGHVAVNKTLVVYSVGNRPDLQVAITNKVEDVVTPESNTVLVYHDACLVGSSQEMAFNANKITLVEKPWRKFIPSSIYDISNPPQEVDFKALFFTFPILEKFYVQGVGLVNPNRGQNFKPSSNVIQLPNVAPALGGTPHAAKTDDFKPGYGHENDEPESEE